MSSTAIYPADTYHIAFEPIADNILRVIVFEEDEDTGCKMVYDIIEMHKDEPLAPRVRLITKFLGRHSTPPLVHYRARWEAPLARLRSEQSRVRRIIKAYPGASACLDEMRDLYTPPAEERPFT
jgi:hypothetical protein